MKIVINLPLTMMVIDKNGFKKNKSSCGKQAAPGCVVWGRLWNGRRIPESWSLVQLQVQPRLQQVIIYTGCPKEKVLIGFCWSHMVHGVRLNHQ